MMYIVVVALLFACSCQTSPIRINRYNNATALQSQSFKKVSLPLLPGTKFKISQGAFGSSSHSEIGNEYSWDIDVPYGTQVSAIEAGEIIGVWQPGRSGGCDQKFSEFAHNIKIEHHDGTVAQYVHISTELKVGSLVTKGQIIAKTAMNGWICQPHLHFGVYESKNQLYESQKRKTIPLFFEGLQNGLALEGLTGEVPLSKKFGVVNDK